MRIDTLQEAIKFQIEVNRFLASKKIKDLVGGYGQLLFVEAAGGTNMSATNQGFDVQHPVYNRVEVKTRRYELKLEGGVKKETRAVGFKGKENGFDWLAHIILDTDYRVVYGTLAKYSEVWPEINRCSEKVNFSVSSSLPSSIDITAALKEAEANLGVGI